MKKHASIVCMMALAWHIGVRPSLAAGTEPPRHPVERPLAAAIAAAGHNHSHLLSQTGSNRISADRELKTALAAAIGFGIGYGSYYFKNRPLDHQNDRAAAMGAGTFCAIIAGLITYKLTGP